MMDAVRPSKENALERNRIDIIMNANSPSARDDSMKQDKIDGQRNEVTTGENGNCLEESINGMEGKS
jgi:hypothetical protein